MHARSLAGTVTLPLLAALLPAQIVVSGGGAALQIAINAAPPGALLVVQQGAYSAVTATRGMRVQLLAGASIVNTTGGPAVQVLDVPLGETFLLAGVGNTVQEVRVANCAGDVTVANVDFQYNSWPTGLEVSGCSGAVTFQDIGPTSLASSGFTMPITNCAQVSFHRAVLLRPPRVVNSRVAMAGVTIPTVISSQGSLRVDSGGVIVDGGSITAGMISLIAAMPAVTVAGGQLTLTGGAVLTAAPAALYPATAPAIAMLGGSLRLDPSVVLNPVAGSPAVAGPGVVQTQPIPSLDLTHTPTTLTANVFAEPAAAVFTLAGLPMAAVLTPWGDAWLSPLDPILDATVMPAGGVHTFAQTLANVSPFAVLTVQSVALTPAGPLVIGAPVRFAWD